jgi:HEAT repeat protein
MADNQQLEVLEADALSTDVRRSVDAANEIIALDGPEQFDILVHLVAAPNLLVAETVLHELEKYGDRVIEPLLALIPSLRPMIQMNVIRVLEKTGDPGLVEPLMRLLETAEHASLRYTLIRALGSLGNPAAIDLIKRFADDPDRHVKKHTEDALARLESIRKDM